ncbi:YraN family protein [Patescibacteria group bacterium]|nr:YraN family protein [Patescibacteria group bacterium]
MKQTEKAGFKNKIGGIGETLAAGWLGKRGFVVVERNYLKKWGEIDIVAHGTDGYHFVEVKTVSYETKESLEWAVTHETWRPEDNVHRTKLERLGRTIETWIEQHGYTGNWKIDVIIVRIVPRDKFATVKMVPNIILD